MPSNDELWLRRRASLDERQRPRKERHREEVGSLHQPEGIDEQSHAEQKGALFCRSAIHGGGTRQISSHLPLDSKRCTRCAPVFVTTRLQTGCSGS